MPHSNCETTPKKRHVNHKIPIQPHDTSRISFIPPIPFIPFKKMCSNIAYTMPSIALGYKTYDAIYDTTNNKLLPCDLIIPIPKKDGYTKLTCIIDNNEL